MYAIVEVAGHQYKVEPKAFIEVNRLQDKEGSKITIEKVLLVQDGDKSDIGTPYVEGAKVEAKVVEHTQGDKIKVFKMKPKKRYAKTIGHRAKLTKLEIVDIKK